MRLAGMRYYATPSTLNSTSFRKCTCKEEHLQVHSQHVTRWSSHAVQPMLHLHAAAFLCQAQGGNTVWLRAEVTALCNAQQAHL